MKIVSSTGELGNEFKGVGLGNFDGLHIGHMALINTLIHESRFNGYSSMIYTFTKHPENILRKELFNPLLTTKEKKAQLLGETALDYLYFEEFDEEYSRISPREFAGDILVSKLNAKLVVTGFNYRFGYKGEGDSGVLEKLGDEFGFKVIVIPPVKVENTIASSTLIRGLVKQGEVKAAYELLGRHYSIDGTVQTGRQIGTRLGFPTANITPKEYVVLPLNGVYVTKTLVDGVLYPSITNIGTKPTLGEDREVSVETHIIDFDKDIYNRSIEVFFIIRLRDEKTYSSMDELKEQVTTDIRYARKYHNLLR
ncbi:MAG: bifunctional riboflavin kinase/FAD synthetase [Eubacteriales bacterium]|nr:bifunctional riboflavin kinase/FAD synthetase [Eubacteriales bacterium]